MKKIDWSYPFWFSIELKAIYRSIWLGWGLITWTDEFKEFDISFQPGL